MIKLVSREEASKAIGREYPNRIRNYELEGYLVELHEQSLVHGNTEKIKYVISEWCPFNGIFCSYFEHATFEDLSQTYLAHQIEVKQKRMHQNVLDDIQKQINTVLNVQVNL